MLAYWGFYLKMSFPTTQKSERLWGFIININLVICRWDLAQTQHMPFFMGFTFSKNVRCQKTFIQHMLCPGNGQLTLIVFEFCLTKTAGLNRLWIVISPELLEPSRPAPEIYLNDLNDCLDTAVNKMLMKSDQIRPIMV